MSKELPLVDGQQVYDPRGIVEVAALPLAGRPKALRGLRLGVLDNTKWNARKLLESTVSLLAGQHGLGVVRYYKKENFSVAATPELLDTIAAENDLALTAVGD